MPTTFGGAGNNLELCTVAQKFTVGFKGWKEKAEAMASLWHLHVVIPWWFGADLWETANWYLSSSAINRSGDPTHNSSLSWKTDFTVAGYATKNQKPPPKMVLLSESNHLAFATTCGMLGIYGPLWSFVSPDLAHRLLHIHRRKDLPFVGHDHSHLMGAFSDVAHLWTLLTWKDQSKHTKTVPKLWTAFSIHFSRWGFYP